MRSQRTRRLAAGGFLGALLIAPPLAAQGTVGTGIVAGGKALANQVNDPTEPITLLQLRNLFAPAWSGSPGGATALEAEFVFPIAEGRLIPVSQLTRTTLPYLWLPDEAGGEAGFGDLSYFDIGLIPAKWGRWGPGITLVIPTGASTTALTQGKWQLGPAMAVILSSHPRPSVRAGAPEPDLHRGPLRTPFGEHPGNPADPDLQLSRWLVRRVQRFQLHLRLDRRGRGHDSGRPAGREGDDDRQAPFCPVRRGGHAGGPPRRRRAPNG